jgi:eukaryotic-like serine/threonine-protein kinase
MTEHAETRPPASGALPVGSIVSERYEIVDVLGEGASGIVYVARCLEPPKSAGGDDVPIGSVKPGDRVALKVIHRHLMRDRQISKRFQREARILRELRCENLVSLLDYGEDPDGVLYMAIELVEGDPLDRLARQGPMPVARAVELVRQVCAGLEVAHAAGVVHRDLKPGNVIVERTPDGRERARVLDFGMAKALSRELSQSLTALTEQNMVFGTPEYMAPEQARGDEVDERCDVYAAGVILYELITGAVPFQASSPIGTMTAHLVQDPEPPSRKTGDGSVPPAVEAVVLHALAKRREDRYPSAAALSSSLAQALRRPGDVASTAPPPLDLDDLATRDTEYALDVRGSAPEAAGRPLEGTSGRTWIFVAIVAAVLGILLGIVFSLSRS